MFDVTKPTPMGLNRRNWPWALTAIVLFLVLLYWADAVTARFVQTWPEPIRAFFEAVTRLGDSDYILIPTLVLIAISAPLAIIGRKYAAKYALWQMTGIYTFIFIAVGLPGLVANLIKRLLGRARPELLDTVGTFGFHRVFNDYTYQSFPSGHTTTAFASALVVGFFSPRLFTPALMIAALVGVSRIAVGAHYPTDVIGGVCLGILGAYVVRHVFTSQRWVFEAQKDGSIKPRPLVAVQRLMKSSRFQASR